MKDTEKKSSSKPHVLCVSSMEVVIGGEVYAPSFNPSLEWFEELARQPSRTLSLVECRGCGYLMNPLFVECALCLSVRQERIAESNLNASYPEAVQG